MPKVTVDHASKASVEEAYNKLKEFFSKDEDLKKIDPKIKFDFSDASLSGKATASQFTADFKVKPDGNGSVVAFVIDLPLLLSPFKGKVQETLVKKLKKYLA